MQDQRRSRRVHRARARQAAETTLEAGGGDVGGGQFLQPRLGQRIFGGAAAAAVRMQLGDPPPIGGAQFLGAAIAAQPQLFVEQDEVGGHVPAP